MPNIKTLAAAWLLALATSALEARAATATADSLQSTGEATEKADTLPVAYRRSTLVGVPLLVGGLITTAADGDLRSARSGHLAEKRGGIDDYLRFAPAAVMLSLKAAGVESRSSWSRMLTSDALSAVIVVGAVKGLKHAASVERPDLADRRSFPSGHTALAFATATMLSEEYGHLSPWVSFGSYALAATTGAMRVAGHHHWPGDVLTGAGIGVVATKLGYLLGDLIFKERGIRHCEEQALPSREDRPSFLSLSVGHQLAFSRYRLGSAARFPLKGGTTAALEGACFLSPWVGLGGRLKTTQVYVCGADDEGLESLYSVCGVSAGAYFSCPLADRWLLGSKALVGFQHYPRLRLSGEELAPRGALALGTGFSVAYRQGRHCALRLFVDYDAATPHSRPGRQMVQSLGAGLSMEMTL